MNKITKDNYFALNNKALSQSKLKDFALCPNYFYRKHISGELAKKETSAFNVGHEVDELLTDMDAINTTVVLTIPEGEKDTYWMTKAGKEYKASVIASGKRVVSQAEYDQIISVADAVARSSAYEVLKRQFTFQEILQFEMDLGPHFDCLYGRPDAYHIDDEMTCHLVDLKTTRDINDRNYYYNAVKLGYFGQLWFYAYLLQKKYPHIKRFRFYHFAVEKTEPFRVKLYEIPLAYIVGQEEYMLASIDKVKNEREFRKADASFGSPTLLVDPKDLI